MKQFIDKLKNFFIFNTIEKNKLSNSHLNKEKLLSNDLLKSYSAYDLFLSYSSNDRQTIIEPLYHELKDEGFTPWFDIKEIKWGDSIVQKMQDGIANTKIIIFFISESYLKKPWTLKELRSIVAMQQISDSQIIFPILLGITEKELIQSVPFLADIKYLKIENYNVKEKVEKKYFQEIIKELERVKDSFQPFKLKSFSHICTLPNPIIIATYGSHYHYHSIKTLQESSEANEIINLNSLINDLFERLEINESKKIVSIGISPTHTPMHLIVLESGNILIVHRGDIHNTPELSFESYIKTNAPSNPHISMLSEYSNEVFLGYKDGSLYVWNNGKGVLLTELKSSITYIDISLESIFVAVTRNGEIGIWARHRIQLKKYIETKNQILSLAVSKTRVRYSKNGIFVTGHKNGIINFWDFDGDKISSYKIVNKPIVSISFFPFGLEYLGVTTVNNVFILNIITGEVVLSFPHIDGNISTLHIGETSDMGFYLKNDDKFNIYITIGCDNGKVFTWRLSVI